MITVVRRGASTRFSSMGKSAHSQTPRGSPKFGSPPGPESWFRRRTGGSVVSNSAAVGNDGLEASFAEEGSPGSGGGGGGGEGRVQAASTPRRKYNSETFSRSRPGSPEPSHAGREDSMDDASDDSPQPLRFSLTREH